MTEFRRQRKRGASDNNVSGKSAFGPTKRPEYFHPSRPRWNLPGSDLYPNPDQRPEGNYPLIIFLSS